MEKDNPKNLENWPDGQPVVDPPKGSLAEEVVNHLSTHPRHDNSYMGEGIPSTPTGSLGPLVSETELKGDATPEDYKQHRVVSDEVILNDDVEVQPTSKLPRNPTPDSALRAKLYWFAAGMGFLSGASFTLLVEWMVRH